VHTFIVVPCDLEGQTISVSVKVTGCDIMTFSVKCSYDVRCQDERTHFVEI